VNALRPYHDLKKRGVLLEAASEKLRVDAPAGELTAEDRTALLEAKPVVLNLLSGRGGPHEDRRRFEARPGRHPGYTSFYDPDSDEWYDFPTRDCFPSIGGNQRQTQKGRET